MNSLKAWAPKGLETLGAVEVKTGALLSPQAYWNHLGFRLKALAEEATPEELEQASSLLMAAGLLDLPLEVEQAGTLLLWENPAMQARLMEAGLPGDLLAQGRILKDDPLARSALVETTLNGWAMEAAGSNVPD